MSQSSSESAKAAFVAARARADTSATAARAKASRLSLVRLFAFFGLVALAVLAGVEVHVMAAVAVVVVGLLLFNKLVVLQQSVDASRDLHQRVVALNDGELASTNYEFTAFDGAVEYRDSAHPYTGDLDVFGPASVFQMINRTATLVGREALASYARLPLQVPQDIAQRQNAVRELAPLLDWRQQFLAAGNATPTQVKALDSLREWAASEPKFTQSWWPLVFWGLSLFNLLWLGSFLYLPFYVALLGYLPTVYVLYRAKADVDVIHQQTEEAVNLLDRYRSMIASVEQQSWKSELLQVLAKAIQADETPISTALLSLASDARQLALRVNPFVLLLNLFSLWEIRYARRLGRWKVKHLAQLDQQATFAPAAAFGLPTAVQPTVAPVVPDKSLSKSAQQSLLRQPVGTAVDNAPLAPAPTVPSNALEQWLLALGAFDALTSLAGLAFRYPDWTFPMVTTDGLITGQGLHHPLLPPARSVPNNFNAPARGHIHLLTGSNMAGKSTFLRTVGLQLAMAHWGSPLPAAQLTLPALSVYTSMRTQDNLHEGASAFYAELRRLRVVVEATRRGEHVFFLLDEILKGTNSQDRHAGGRALLEQLIGHGGAGIVATHDLELGEMAADSSQVDNLRLEVEADAEGQLYFDYTVKPGLAQSRNASILMEQMGLGTD